MTNKYASKKYGLGIALQATKHHPYGEGAEHLSAEELVRKGYAAHHNYAHVAKELQAIGNVGNVPRFKEAAKLARERAYREGDYEKECKSCGLRHGTKRKVMV